MLQKVKYLAVALFMVFMASCAEEEEAKLSINEVFFNQEDLNIIEGIEIYNPGGISIDAEKTLFVINDKEFPLDGANLVEGDGYLFYKIKAEVDNKEFTISVKVNGKVVTDFVWKGNKKSKFLGRLPNGGSIFRLSERSINGSNERSKVKVKAPGFNIESGFYEKKQTLMLNREYDDIPMYYTLDGSEPTIESKEFTNELLVRKNTVIRAKYIGDNLYSKTSVTSIFIGEKINLPVVSVSVDSVAMWGEEDGLMMKGLLASEDYPYKGANYWMKSKLSANIQYFDENRKLILDDKAELKIHGNYSRACKMKGLRITADGKDKIFSFKPFKDKELSSFSALMNVSILKIGFQLCNIMPKIIKKNSI